MAETVDLRLARSLRIWLYLVALLIAAMVLIGGATRLTESGLSITEWKPISGTLPPLNEQSWQKEFQKYRQIPQYKELNSGMSLDEFKTIYWWEWTHRFLGRVIGLAFALPFLFFTLAKNLPRPLVLKLGGIFLLGGLQGGIGWWMVASGLADRIEVAPYRLAIHLTLALVIFAAVLQVAMSLNPSSCSDLIRASQNKKRDPRDKPEDDDRNYRNAQIMLTLIFLQIFLGGLVAGTRAGYAHNTWPLMDGGIVPPGLFAIEPWWRNFFENTAMVQFLHRCTAYVLLISAGWNLWRTFQPSLRGGALAPTKQSSLKEETWIASSPASQAPRNDEKRAALWLLCALLLQAALGVATLLSQMNFTLALMHQAGSVIIVTLVVLDASLCHDGLHKACQLSDGKNHV